MSPRIIVLAVAKVHVEAVEKAHKIFLKEKHGK
jgi:hypothetical protein